MDKYADLSLPTTTGFSSVKNNNGDFRNSGIEMELSGTILKIKDWTWKMGGNISYNKNKVVTLPDNGQPKNRIGGQQIYTGRKVLDEAGNQVDEVIFVGGKQERQEPGILVGYKAEGLYKSWDDIPENLIVKREIIKENINMVRKRMQHCQMQKKRKLSKLPLVM